MGYLPGTSGAHSSKAPLLCTAKQPRGMKRKPRSDSCRVLQEQRSSQQQRRSGKRAQELRCVPLSAPRVQFSPLARCDPTALNPCKQDAWRLFVLVKHSRSRLHRGSVGAGGHLTHTFRERSALPAQAATTPCVCRCSRVSPDSVHTGARWSCCSWACPHFGLHQPSFGL